MPHPSDRLKGARSSLLAKRHVVMGVSGSIAAVEAVKIIHELRRHGADVTVVMTKAAQSFVTPLALEYASGRPVVTRLTGMGEHVGLCDGRKGSGDVLLLAPTTANTLSKVALGIDDTPVTSCATVALGAHVPVVVAPAMHDVMFANAAIRRRLEDLRSAGVHFVEPQLVEEKAKLATPEAIVDGVVRALAGGPWVGRRVVVISGATAEPIDPIRVVTNRSSGRMGVELARAAFHQGASAELWNAWGLVPLPDHLPSRRFETVDDLVAMVRKEDWSDVDAVLMPAALSDFAPVRAESKIHSEAERVDVAMRALPKVILEVRKRAKNAVLVAFKAESDEKILAARAKDRLEKYGADLVVANTTQGFGGPQTSVLLMSKGARPRTLTGAKTDVASAILEAAGRLLAKRGSA